MNVLFVLFMALYMTVDGGKILDYVIVFFPLSRQPQSHRVMTNITVRLSHWVVGQLLLALVIGTVAGVGLGLLGVPGAAVLAMIWMIAEFIPGIGPFIAAVPSILLGFLAGPTTGILATIFTLAWSQVESNVVTPRLMGRAVEINSLVVLVALLVGNELLGLLGALFAIPAAAAIAVVVDELRRQRLENLERGNYAPRTPGLTSTVQPPPCIMRSSRHRLTPSLWQALAARLVCGWWRCCCRLAMRSRAPRVRLEKSPTPRGAGRGAVHRGRVRRRGAADGRQRGAADPSSSIS